MMAAIPQLVLTWTGVVKTDTETENWRRKYFDSLNALEKEQQQFRVTEATLKRLAGRLCSASLGQSSQLDEQVRKLQNAIRREATSDELERITPGLTEAIQALDHSAAAPAVVVAAPVVPAPSVVAAQPAKTQPDTSHEAIVADERVRAILASLLAELRRDDELIEQVDALDSKLTPAMTRDQLSEVLASLTELVGQRINRIERAKQEIEGLLSHMVGKLDEIGQFVAEQNRSQSESQASSETLNVQLADDMRAMGESVESAGDLPQIRRQVRSRLESIDRHLQEFRQREDTLSSAVRERNEQMRARIVELEGEAKRLQHQVKDEQRLAMLDALTKIPNRLAYEKRMDEELTRWRRFKQPTCLAVWDVDHFKRVNDTYGHRAGDRVLRAVAECLAGRIRATDFVARYGGEEFVMILPGTPLDDATRLVEAMRTAICGIGFHFRGVPVSITISSGVTALLAGDSSEAVFDRADKALYQAKENGRNCSVAL
jgi:diguanylate cyclase